MTKEKMFWSSFGRFIKNIRQINNISQSELAKKSGIGRLTIHKVELGTQKVSFLTAYSLLSSLEVSFTAFVEDYESGQLSKQLELLKNDKLKEKIEEYVEFYQLS